MNLYSQTSASTPAMPLTAPSLEAQAFFRVSPDRPFQAGWKAYGGHRMYVGAFESALGDWILLATDKAHEAAGFETVEECERAMVEAGFLGPNSRHIEIGPFKGQMALF